MHEQQKHDETETLDDSVVGSAIKWSLIGGGIMAFAIAMFLIIANSRDDEVVENEEKIVVPTERKQTQLEIPDLLFTDITEEAGIDFVHTSGAAGEKLLPETMGAGGAFFDFDQDGDQDILCINSTHWPWSDEAHGDSPTSKLYANDGHGKFTDVTEAAQFGDSFYGCGTAVGDFDNDGLVDVFVSAVGPNRLYRNLGGGRFQDITSGSGIDADNDKWSTSCGWFDYDLDGDLDLLVCNYVVWSREIDRTMDFTLDGTLRAYGRPAEFRGVHPQLFRNAGDGTFEDVAERVGLQVNDPNSGQPLAKSLGLCLVDLNDDGRLDIVIANDTVQNLCFMNQADGTFEEIGSHSGIAFDSNGQTRGAMGTDSARFRNSPAVGIAIGNFANEMTALYVNQLPESPQPVFRDEAVSNGIGPVTRIVLTFGVFFADLDLDGRLDLFAANGHLEEDIQKVQVSQHYEQPPQLLWNCGPEQDDEFCPVPPEKVGDDFLEPMVGRGATYADIDADGDLDILIFATGGPPRLLRNDQQAGHHWLRVKLEGTQSNRDAIGAEITARLSDGTTLFRTVMPTRSYQSQVELPVTFGLGEFKTVDELSVRWPSGVMQKVENVATDQLLELKEPGR